MSPIISQFNFKIPPKRLDYLDGEALKLTNELSFFHNKNKFRKELTRLQLDLKNYINQTLPASGIRDSYLKEEYTENYFIVILTNNEKIKNANHLIESIDNLEITRGNFYLESKSDYVLLLAKDMNGLISGIDYFEEILVQILEDFLNQKKFDEFIQIRPFILSSES